MALIVGCAAKGPEPSVAPLTTAPALDASLAVIDRNDASERLVGPDESAMDRSVDPCDDFYGFACGGWMRATAIPEDEAKWVRSFSVIHEGNEKSLRAILERDARGDTRDDPYGRQLGDLWTSCMDEDAIEARGAKDLKSELARIEAVADAKSLVVELARLHSMGVGAGFSFDSEIDAKDSRRMIAGLSQGGLGLPERDYYLRIDSRSKDLRVEYERHVARTLELSGETPRESATHARWIISLETELAKASMSNVDLRDPRKVYHRIDLVGLRALAPQIAWDAYLAELGFPAITAINVGQPEFIKQVAALAKTVPWRSWHEYLRWHFVRSLSPYLSRAFVEQWFQFRQTLTGAKTLQPRWKRCVQVADQLMGEALARPFVIEHLGSDGKRAAEDMVHGIESSMKRDLETVAWMDDATRTKAEEKLAAITNKIGYPSKWRSYDGLEVDRESFLGNVEHAFAFEVKRSLAKAGGPVDPGEWEMTPPTVNAYYEPTRNEMVFPAGILQVPFYGRSQSPAMNFGSIGMVIGHELTHGFDDAGRRFDADGNLRDWWTSSVGVEFDRRTSCVEKQYDEYVATGDSHINGKLTLGENIADLGGLKLALATFLRDDPQHATATFVGGFSRQQEFFMSFAQSWCANYRPEALRLLVATNPHSPPRFRVIGPLSNLPEFAAAFDCKAGLAMVRPAENRCEVW